MGDRRPLATAEQVSEYLGVPVATLYAWRHRKTGPTAMRVGRNLRWRWDEIEKWLERQTAA